MIAADYLVMMIGATIGGFSGTCAYFWVWCPNHGCCRSKKLKECLEE